MQLAGHQQRISAIIQSWYSVVTPEAVQHALAANQDSTVLLLKVERPTVLEAEAFTTEIQSYLQGLVPADVDVHYAPYSGRLYLTRGWPRYCDGCKGVVIYSTVCSFMGALVMILIIVFRHSSQ